MNPRTETNQDDAPRYIVGQDERYWEATTKNDGKLTSSLLYYYFCGYSLLLEFLYLFLMFLMFFPLVECSIYNVTFNILFLLIAQINDKISVYLPLEKKNVKLRSNAARKLWNCNAVLRVRNPRAPGPRPPGSVRWRLILLKGRNMWLFYCERTDIIFKENCLFQTVYVQLLVCHTSSEHGSFWQSCSYSRLLYST